MATVNPVFRVPVTAAALASLSVAVLRSIEPFDHGIWLVSYLFLVGTAAQYLLSRGQDSIHPETRLAVIRAEALLWSIGVLAVPLGVLGDSKLLVLIGSAALLASLSCFLLATTSRGDLATGSGLAVLRGYRVLLVFLTSSVFIGMALAWGRPWI